MHEYNRTAVFSSKSPSFVGFWGLPKPSLTHQEFGSESGSFEL